MTQSVAWRLAQEALDQVAAETGIEFPPISPASYTTEILVVFCDTLGEFARFNLQLKLLTSERFKIKRKFDWEYVTLSTAKGMGFTESQLSELGQPILAKNPHFASASKMKLYPRHWLQKVTPAKPPRQKREKKPVPTPIRCPLCGKEVGSPESLHRFYYPDGVFITRACSEQCFKEATEGARDEFLFFFGNKSDALTFEDTFLAAPEEVVSFVPKSVKHVMAGGEPDLFYWRFLLEMAAKKFPNYKTKETKPWHYRELP